MGSALGMDRSGDKFLEGWGVGTLVVVSPSSYMGVSSLVSWSITHTHRKMQNGLTNITQTLVRTEMKRKSLQRPTNSHGSCPSHGPPSSQWDYSGCEENCFPGFHQFYHLGLDL